MWPELGFEPPNMDHSPSTEIWPSYGVSVTRCLSHLHMNHLFSMLKKKQNYILHCWCRMAACCIWLIEISFSSTATIEQCRPLLMCFFFNGHIKQRWATLISVTLAFGIVTGLHSFHSMKSFLSTQHLLSYCEGTLHSYDILDCNRIIVYYLLYTFSLKLLYFLFWW